MKRQYHAISIELNLMAPYLIHGADPGRFGLDAVLLRNHEGKLAIPGTLLAGRIRDAWRQLDALQSGSMPAPETWFGKKSHLDDARPASGLLIDDDLVLTHAGGLPLDNDGGNDIAQATQVIVRITQDDTTGAVRPGHLQLIEQIGRAGQVLRFAGAWRVYATPAEAKALTVGIRAGLAWQTQLGALRNAGFGRLHGIAVSTAPAVAGAAPALSGRRSRIALCIDAPICVNTYSRGGNIFESGDIVPGGAIKGALARTLMALHDVASLEQIADSSLLAKHFHLLRITHALPADDGQRRPIPLPQSLLAGGQRIGDAVLCKTPQLVVGADGKTMAPKFPVDWKTEQFDEANRQTGWGKTERHLRVRTAMDADKRTAAAELLFSYEMCFAKGQTRWLCDLDFGAITLSKEREAVQRELGGLLAHGLDFIGKTKARARVVALEQTAYWPDRFVAEDGYWIVHLVTPVQLFTVNELPDAEKDLTTLYRTLFATLSGGVLTLSHHFSSQSIAGGRYLHTRFSNGAKGAPYRPWLLTDAGSVFVFTAADNEKAAQLLAAWRDEGLPVPACVAAVHGSDWRTSPYLTQNGYGEIAINPRHGFERIRPTGPASAKEQA